jgi:hypothetical protein
VGQGNWQGQLATNKQNYLNDFVTRPEFTSKPAFSLGVSAATYVDALFANSGVTPTAAERSAAISAYGSGDTALRAAALRSVIESGSVFNAAFNPAFVLMEYFGYSGATLTMRLMKLQRLRLLAGETKFVQPARR